MRKFVQSIRKIFKKDNPEENAQSPNKEEQSGQKKISMSCARKKKKPQSPGNNNRPPARSNESMKRNGQQSPQKSMAAPAPEAQTRSPIKSQMSPATQSKMSPANQPKSRMSPAPNAPKAMTSIRRSPTDKAGHQAKTASPEAVPKSMVKNPIVAKQPATDKTKSGYSTIPKSDKPKTKTQRSKSAPSESGQESKSQRSFRKFKDFSQRTLRKVKTFVSRPINQATLNKVAQRVKTRKKEEQPEKLTHGEDCFPKMQRRENATPKKKSGIEVFPNVKSTYGNVSPDGQHSIKTTKNNNNEGKMFIEKNGRMEPWWTKTRRPTDEDLEDSDTDDELQLNAEVVLEVLQGKTKLVNMPSIPVVLDPYNEINDLQRRDKLFFNRDVLFGNTVRTMINLSDQASTKGTPKTKRKGNPISIEEPTTMKSYGDGDWTKFHTIEFHPSESKRKLE